MRLFSGVADLRLHGGHTVLEDGGRRIRLKPDPTYDGNRAKYGGHRARTGGQLRLFE